MACNSIFLVSGLTINDCCSGNTNSTLFTSGNSITLGEYLYTDSLCSVPASDGYYAVEEYRATWGQIDSGIGNPGEIIATGTCFDCSLTGVCTIVPQFTTFSDCCNENYIFNVYHDIGTFLLGEVYLLNTSIFSGCATVVSQDTKYPFYCMNTATLEVDCTTCNSNNSIVCTIYTCDNGCYDLFTNGLTPYDGRYCKPGYDTYNNYNYYVDIDTETYFIYYDSSKWCLSTSLGGSCLLFGNETCNEVCPDLCTELNISEYTTTTTSPCDIVDFEALFDCEMTPTPTPTPSITPTNTLTPTPTPTPTSTDLCGYTSISLSATTLPGSSPTPTPTPSQTPQIRDNCFSGDATFNIFTAEFDCPPD